MPPKKKNDCIRPNDPTDYKWISDYLITCPGSEHSKTNYTGFLKAPICREGNKKDLLKCLFPLFPQEGEAPDLFVDLFMGSGVVSLNYARGLSVPPDGKGAGGKGITVGAKPGCEIWANDLSTVIPEFYKAFKDKDEAFINRVVAEGKKYDHKKTYNTGASASEAITKLSLKGFENKRTVYALNKRDFGNTPKDSQGGLMALKGQHKTPGHIEGGKTDEEMWADFKAEWVGKKKPNYKPANAWMDAKVAQSLLRKGLVEEKDVLRKDGEVIGMNGVYKTYIGTPIQKEGVLTEKGFINIVATTCGSVGSMGFGYAYKYVAPKKAELMETHKNIQRITYFNEEYVKILQKIEEWHTKNPTKKIFVFCDPPYPEGLDRERSGSYTYGDAFNNVKLAENLRILYKQTKGMAKILVTNGYQPWLGNVLKWQRFSDGSPYWNIYRLTVGARGGDREGARQELLYTNYDLTIAGGEKKKVPTSKFPPDYQLGQTDKPEGVFKCMPIDEEWQYIKDKVKARAKHFVSSGARVKGDLAEAFGQMSLGESKGARVKGEDLEDEFGKMSLAES